jgi:hypothetical protein
MTSCDPNELDKTFKLDYLIEAFWRIHLDDWGPECAHRFWFQVRLLPAGRNPVDRRVRAGIVDNVGQRLLVRHRLELVRLPGFGGASYIFYVWTYLVRACKSFQLNKIRLKIMKMRLMYFFYI